MSDNLVSIVVPVYNAENYLSECVNSIIGQSYKNLEIILVNDGSTDSSLELCRELAKSDSRISVIDQKNNGVSSARNAGIGKCTGKWVAFIDSDDIVADNYIEKLLAGVGGSELAYCDFSTLEEGKYTNFGFVNGEFDIPLLAKACLANRITGMEGNPTNFGVPWAKLFSMEIIKSSGLRFTEGLAYMEDMLFTLEYLMHCNNVSHVDDNLYIYRMNPNSAMHKSVPNFKNYAVTVIEKLRSLQHDYKILSQLKAEFDYKIFLIYIQLTDLAIMPLDESSRNKAKMLRNEWNDIFSGEVSKPAIDRYGTKFQQIYYKLISCKMYNALQFILAKRYNSKS